MNHIFSFSLSCNYLFVFTFVSQNPDKQIRCGTSKEQCKYFMRTFIIFYDVLSTIFWFCQIFAPDKQKFFYNALLDYWNSVCDHLLQMHRELQKIDRSNR